MLSRSTGRNRRSADRLYYNVSLPIRASCRCQATKRSSTERSRNALPSAARPAAVRTCTSSLLARRLVDVHFVAVTLWTDDANFGSAAATTTCVTSVEGRHVACGHDIFARTSDLPDTRRDQSRTSSTQIGMPPNAAIPMTRLPQAATWVSGSAVLRQASRQTAFKLFSRRSGSTSSPAKSAICQYVECPSLSRRPAFSRGAHRVRDLGSDDTSCIGSSPTKKEPSWIL